MGEVHSMINSCPKMAFPDAKGYMRVQLYRTGGKQITRKVHRLVAEHFIPNPGHLRQVNHIDGVKTNNQVGNLEWTTQAENMAHAVSHGLCLKKAKLKALLPQIKFAMNQGYVLEDIARNYQTSSKTIKRYLYRFPVEPAPITTLRTGRRRSYVYFDSERGKWRTELRKFRLPNKQFDSQKEAEAYASRRMKEHGSTR
jgi:hypothetical protein